MNPFTPLPNEILFQCVSGSPSPHLNRTFIQNFGRNCRDFRRTCRDLNQRVDECWKLCLGVLWEDWKNCSELQHLSKEQFIIKRFPSFSFVVNWMGAPKITRSTLMDMLQQGFSLHLEPKDKCTILQMSKSTDTIPTFWTSLASQNTLAFTRSTPYGDATFVNIKTGKFLGEIVGRLSEELIFDKNIEPIFYENGVFLLFRNVFAGSHEIHFYEMEKTKLSFKRKAFLPFESVQSMYLFKDHLFFQTPVKNSCKYEVLSMDEFKNCNTPTFIQSKLLSPSYKHLVLKEKVVRFFESELACQVMQFYEGGLEFSDHDISIDGGFFHYLNHTLYYNDQHAFLLFYELGKPLISLPQNGFAKLVQYKNTVILCSGKMGGPLQFHHVDAKNSELITTPLEIQSTLDYKFNRIDCVYAHLDKLFIIGVLAKGETIPSTNNYLVIVSMETKSVENKYAFDLDIHPKIIATGLGCLYIFNPKQTNILQIKY